MRQATSSDKVTEALSQSNTRGEFAERVKAICGNDDQRREVEKFILTNSDAEGDMITARDLLNLPPFVL